MAYYEPRFKFSESPTIRILCKNKDDVQIDTLLGVPPGENHESPYHLTVAIQEGGSRPGDHYIEVPCPRFTQAESGRDVTVHVIVLNQNVRKEHKKKTGQVPTGIISIPPLVAAT